MSPRWTSGSRNGLEVVEIDAPAAHAVIALQGAQVLSFQPRGDHDWMWVSERARWAPATALRGGIPVCFPWFGPHPTEPSFPAHGFARTRAWRVEDTREVGEGFSVRLGLSSDDETRKLFPHAFEARLTVSVGTDLALALEVRNLDATPFSFEVAFHSYLPSLTSRPSPSKGCRAARTSTRSPAAGGGAKGRPRCASPGKWIASTITTGR